MSTKKIDTKLIARTQEQAGYYPMEPIYLNHAIHSRVILITKAHTTRLIAKLGSLGIIVTGVDTDSYTHSDTVYTSTVQNNI